MSELKPFPPINAETQPFWQGCARGELLLQQCRVCQKHQFYPRLLCSHCGARDLDWFKASGRGRVRTFTIIRRAVSAAFEADVPYVVALIELDEGPTMMSNVVDCDAEQVHLGMAVMVRFEARSNDVVIPLFHPI